MFSPFVNDPPALSLRNAQGRCQSFPPSAGDDSVAAAGRRISVFSEEGEGWTQKSETWSNGIPAPGRIARRSRAVTARKDKPITELETRVLLADGTVVLDGTAFRECDVCPVMVVLPAGSFEMGSLTLFVRPATAPGHVA
jgi:hypothetical protein